MASKDDAIDLTGDNYEKSSPSPIKKRRKKSEDEAPTKLSPQTSPTPTATNSTNKPHPLTICTYNIWFGRQENAGPFGVERMKALMEAMLPYEPRFIGLQEVTPFLALQLAPLLEAAGYKVYSQRLLTEGYGTAVAVRVDYVVEGGFVPFKRTQLQRGISWALCQLDGREVLFTTTHAESWCAPSYTGATEREVQLKEMTSYCEQWMKKRPSIDLAIITGDLNWDDWRPKSRGDNTPLEQVVGPEWLDCWKLLYPDIKADPGYTYDGKVNPMLSNSLRRRFDRVLILSNKKSFSVEEAVLVGQNPIPGLFWDNGGSKKKELPVTPSDHFGLVVKVQY